MKRYQEMNVVFEVICVFDGSSFHQSVWVSRSDMLYCAWLAQYTHQRKPSLQKRIIEGTKLTADKLFFGD